VTAARTVRVGLVGFGNVGRAFARLLYERRRLLRERYGAEPVLVFIADSRGYLASPRGLSWDTVLQALEAPRGGVSRLPGGRPGGRAVEAIEETGVDVLVDAAPSRYDSPGEAVEWWSRVLGSGAAVVAADKAPLATGCGRFLSGSWGRRVYYKATVMAGTPLIDLLRWGMAGRVVRRVTGVLNGTTNYVLGLAEKGVGFHEAVRDAQEKGYAEPDPSADLEGLDLAAKAAIVSCTLGVPLTLWDVERRGRVDEEAFRAALEAARRGRRLRYVATVEPGRGARVELVEVGPENPLYGLTGVLNGALIEPEEAEPVYVQGPGAGRLATAASLLADLAEVLLQGVV
jgi:homoserine dehydrogenase